MIVENVVDFIEMTARRRPEKVALIQNDRGVTYAELVRRLRALATMLQARGLKRGDIVGVGMRDGVDYVAMMLAVFRIGLVMLPMDSRWTAVEKTNVAGHFGARAVVLSQGGETEVGDAEVIHFEDAMFSIDSSGLKLPENFSQDEPVVLSLSSGTTGIPKGPMITHRHVMLRNFSDWIGLGYLHTDVNLVATPMYFGGARLFTITYLCSGATVVINSPPYDLPELADVIRRHGVTTTFFVPTLLRRIAALPDDLRAAFQGLRFIISSGSSLHPQESAELSEKVNACLINLYASTEGGCVSMHHPAVEGPANGSVGRTVLGSEMQIVDQDGRELPRGETGLIRHRAPWHPKGFHNNPEETRRSFREGWYYPGDVGHIDDDGYLFITGRSKDMIIRGGVNIYPDEIEAVLLGRSEIVDVAVVGRPSADLGEEIVAFVVVEGRLDPDALKAHCRDALAPYKTPVEFIAIPAMPRNQSGKILKPELRARFADRMNPSAA